MLLELIPSDASSPLSFSERDLAALAACERGTILLDVSARADATLMTLTGTNGRIALELRGGRLYGEQVLGADGSPAAGPQAASNTAKTARRAASFCFMECTFLSDSSPGGISSGGVPRLGNPPCAYYACRP